MSHSWVPDCLGNWLPVPQHWIFQLDFVYNAWVMVEKQEENRPRRQVQALEDEELQALRNEIARAREYLAVLEVELFNTHSALDTFQRRFNVRIAPLERRLTLLQAQLKQALEARRQPDDAPEPEFKRADNGKAREGERGGEEKFYAADDASEDENGKLDPATEEELRALFRELAKRFHPDLVRDLEEKRRREEVMTQVSQAYAAKDIETLRKLSRRPDLEAERKSRTRRREKEILRSELEYLNEKIGELEQRCRALDQSPAMQLRMEVNMARQVGRDLLSDMAAHLEERIADIEDHLYALGEEPTVTAV
ncbi:MAG: hypothetical protein JXB38_09370 [Anaerolineales bacterium]|nr:hypothetical protein [Anaerolineales bacterium]